MDRSRKLDPQTMRALYNFFSNNRRKSVVRFLSRKAFDANWALVMYNDLTRRYMLWLILNDKVKSLSHNDLELAIFALGKREYPIV